MPSSLVHRFLMLAPVSAFLSPSLHRLDALALRLSGERWTFTALAGLPIIELTTVGAKSGQRRKSPLVSLKVGDRIALIASNFGRPHHPAWYHNLKAHPECEVRWNGTTIAYLAREAQGQERKMYWQLAVSYYLTPSLTS